MASPRDSAQARKERATPRGGPTVQRAKVGETSATSYTDSSDVCPDLAVGQEPCLPSGKVRGAIEHKEHCDGPHGLNAWPTGARD